MACEEPWKEGPRLENVAFVRPMRLGKSPKKTELSMEKNIINGDFKHGSLNVPIEHHPTMNGIWSIMATFSGDVQYSQNGTVTNPC